MLKQTDYEFIRKLTLGPSDPSTPWEPGFPAVPYVKKHPKGNIRTNRGIIT